MTKTTLLLLATGIAASAMPVSAKNTDPTKMTCAEFLALGDDVQPRAIAWLDGYSRAGKLEHQDVAEEAVDRRTDVLVVACRQDPKKTVWEKIRSHLPGGSKTVKPGKMTCQEYVDLAESERPEVVYWVDGYERAAKGKQSGVGRVGALDVDLERDVGVVYEECKQAPGESLWSKIKKHL